MHKNANVNMLESSSYEQASEKLALNFAAVMNDSTISQYFVMIFYSNPQYVINRAEKVIISFEDVCTTINKLI